MTRKTKNLFQALILIALCAWGYANATGKLPNAITFDIPDDISEPILP